MKYQVIIRVCSVVSNTKEVYTVVSEGEAVDELQARGIASNVSGCNFLDVKDRSPYGEDAWDNIYIVKLTDTTSWLLKVKR